MIDDIRFYDNKDRDLILSDSKYDFRITEFTVDDAEYKHISKAYEIFTVISGCGRLQHGLDSYNICAGSTFFFHDGEAYSVSSDGDRLQLKVIGFSNTFYSPFNENSVSFFDISYSKRKTYTQLEHDEFEHFKYLLSIMDQHSLFFTAYNRFTLVSVINLILLHYFTVTDGTKNISNQDDIGKALRYIYDKFRLQSFSITEMAEKLHFSPTYLSKKFKNQVGTSIQLYVLDLRLEFAADLLVGTNLSVSDVSASAGFNSTSYFIKQFKKKYGVTPKKYTP